VLCALGRVANVEALALVAAGLGTTPRGLLQVDEHCRTKVPHIYAVGDVSGPPSLASSAMEQGRRAVRHALGLSSGERSDLVPFCAYTIPEIASAGLSEAEATAQYGSCFVGRAPYRELARAHIAGYGEGMVKLVVAPDGKKLLGVQVVGDSASELVTVGQMALLGGLEVETFVEATFNYPTLAEGYRVAALDALKRVAAAGRISQVGLEAAAE
jgi:NAD(P) transhydrogenase